jgi:hypothetical protein
MKAKRTRRGTSGGWAGDMRLKKLKAAREKWLQKQQAQQRPQDYLQLIANSVCPVPSCCAVKVKTKEGWMPKGEDDFDPKKCSCGSGLEKDAEYDARGIFLTMPRAAASPSQIFARDFLGKRSGRA